MSVPGYVVRITGEHDAGQVFNGTGFFVSTKGHVATCRHVVTHDGGPAKRIRVHVHSYSDAWEYLILDSSEADDLAILQGVVPPTNETAVAQLHSNWSRDVTSGQELIIYGHSSADNYPTGQQYPSTISAFSEKDGRVGVIGEINPGDSGGPVIDREKRVIGIVNAKDRSRDGQARFIPVSLLINLLIKNDISFGPLHQAVFTDSAFADRAYNPFTSRKGIKDPDAFFNREHEQLTIRDFLHARENCQIVGPRRIGKTSLLLQVGRVISSWEKKASLAYVDLHDARSYQLFGWLDHVSRKFSWSRPATNLAEFARSVEEMISESLFPVLCLDEFDELSKRRDEFGRDFYTNLRSCGNMGMTIITASQKRLNHLTDPDDPTSPFYNTFPTVRLGAFSDATVTDFLSLSRGASPAFTPDQQRAIKAFSKGLPLALQVACFHVFEANANGGSLADALQKAEEDLKGYLHPKWQ